MNTIMLYINSRKKKNNSRIVLKANSSYADDTQIFFAHNDYREVDSAINSDLELVDR